MSLLMHETPVKCGKCGENKWRIIRYVYNMTTMTNESHELEPVCRGCDPLNFFGFLKLANRIEPMLPTGPTQKVKGGTATKMEEQKLDGKVTIDYTEKATDDLDDEKP